MIPINVRLARKRFDHLCMMRNAEMPVIVVNRVTPKGEQTYERRTKAVSDGAQSTGKALIQSYVRSYTEKSKLRESLPADLIADEFPSLLTNSERMAKYRQNVTSRTIRNHIKELKELGLISDYKFHGSKHDFEIWINPEVLFGAENVSLTKVPDFDSDSTETPVFSVEKSASLSTNDTNFPHKQCKELKDTKQLSTNKVEKHAPTKVTQYGNNDRQPENRGVDDNLSVMETMEGGGGRGGNTVDKVDEMWIKSDTLKLSEHLGLGNVVLSEMYDGAGADFERLHPYFQNAVRDFWGYARKMLWPEREFSMYEWLRVADTITNSVYREFLNKRPNKNQFHEFHEELMKAVNIAKKYYDKHPEQYPGNPFSSGEKASGYFDHRNVKGFRTAIGWRFKNKASQDEEYGKRMIKTAMLHLKNHQTGRVPKYLQVKTFSEVMNFYLTKMKRFNPEIQSEFLLRLSTLNIFR